MSTATLIFLAKPTHFVFRIELCVMGNVASCSLASGSQYYLRTMSDISTVTPHALCTAGSAANDLSTTCGSK